MSALPQSVNIRMAPPYGAGVDEKADLHDSINVVRLKRQREPRDGGHLVFHRAVNQKETPLREDSRVDSNRKPMLPSGENGFHLSRRKSRSMTAATNMSAAAAARLVASEFVESEEERLESESASAQNTFTSSMKRVVSSPMLARPTYDMLAPTEMPLSSPRQSIFLAIHQEGMPALPSPQPEMKRVRRMPNSLSAPDLDALVSQKSPLHSSEASYSSTSEDDSSLSSSSSSLLSSMEAPSLLPRANNAAEFANTNPNHLLLSLLQSQGCVAQTYSSLELENFFLPTSPEHVAGYGPDIIAAVRHENLDALRHMHSSGQTLQCCNKFGESILHMACRRGSIRVMRCLLLECDVSIRVMDDYGRTPLHDALWAEEPQLDLVRMLVDICPDLLLLRDRRGFTPLSYVRRDHWPIWCRFLEEHKEMVIPRELQ